MSADNDSSEVLNQVNDAKVDEFFVDPNGATEIKKLLRWHVKEVLSLEKKSESLMRSNKSNDQKIQQLMAEIASLRASNSALKMSPKRDGSSVKASEDALLEEGISSLRKSNASLQQKIASQKADFASLKSWQKQQLNLKDAQIASHEVVIASNKEVISSKNALIASQEEMIAMLKAQLMSK
jgi:hypothetical protein